MAIYLTPDGLNSTTSGEMPNYPQVFSRVSGTTSYTDVNGNTNYTAPAIKIGTFTSTSASCFLRGRYIKTGDLNYSNLITDVSFVWHQWSNQNTRYNLRVEANQNINQRNSYWWVDSSRSLWCWQQDLWSMYGRIIIEAADRCDFVTGGSNDNMAPSDAQTKAYTGQTRQLCNNTTSISLEDTFGSPA